MNNTEDSGATMNDYVEDILGKARNNSYFRLVLETGENMQVVLMSLLPGEEIGSEVHMDNEQVLIAVEGRGEVILDGEKNEFNKGDMVLVRAGREHNFINTGETELKIITVYSPPHHEDGTMHKTKADAEYEDEGEHTLRS